MKEPTGKDIEKLSNWIAQKFSRCDHLISFEDRIQIASQQMLKTLSYRKDKSSYISSTLLVKAATSAVSKAIKKEKKYIDKLSLEMYLKNKTQNKTISTVYDDRDHVAKILQSLSEIDQEIVFLRFWGSKTWLEIGKAVGKSNTHVRQRYLDCLRRIRQKKKEEHLDDPPASGEIL